MSIYNYSAIDIAGQESPLSSYQNKVVLVVNVASKCGFTPQYEGLQALYEQFAEQGLEILGFPCNQFGKQEPGNEEQIQGFCSLNYNVSFPMFAKVDVNGSNAHPLYQYLKKAQGGMVTDGIKWNFTKFLINRDGTPVKRYPPTTKPEDIAEDIRALL